MSLFNDFLDNLKDLRENLDLVSKKLKDNSKQIQSQAKIKFEIASEKRSLEKIYQALGKEVYDANKDNNNDQIDFEEYIKQIDISIARLESLKIKLDDFNNSVNYPDNNQYTQKAGPDNSQAQEKESSITINEDQLIRDKSYSDFKEEKDLEKDED